MDTDILGGNQLGFRTILVLSGGTKRSDLHRFAFSPDEVVDSLASVDDAFIERQKDIMSRALGASSRS